MPLLEAGAMKREAHEAILSTKLSSAVYEVPVPKAVPSDERHMT